jgi:hypothetical protein
MSQGSKLRDCPSCSVLKIGYRKGPIIWRLPRTERYTILACCKLSRGAPVCHPETTEEDATDELTLWWEEQRQMSPEAWRLIELDKETA